MAVEVLAAAVRRSWSSEGRRGGQRSVRLVAGLRRRGRPYERRSEHVRVNAAEPSALADRTDPAMGGSTIEPLALASSQDRPLVALADSQVDGASGSRHERDSRRLVALPDDPQRSMASLNSEIFDVGGACFAHPQPVETMQQGKGGVRVVVPLGREQEQPQLGAVQAACVGGMHWWPSDVLGRVGADAAIDVSEPVEAAHRGRSPVDRRRREPATLHLPSEQLDVRARRPEDLDGVVGRPRK